MRARWHQLLKLSCVCEENSRDSVRAEVPTSLEPLRVSAPARPFEAPHFVAHFLAGGGRPAVAAAAAANARGEVRTTLDLGLNHFITDALRKHLAGLRTEHVGNGAVVVIDNRTGGVTALVGSADFLFAAWRPD